MITKTEASAMLQQYGEDLKTLSQGRFPVEGRRCASTILSALNSIVYDDNKEFVNTSRLRVVDANDAIRLLASSKEFAEVVSFETKMRENSTVTLNLAEFIGAAHGVTPETKRQGDLVSKDFEQQAAAVIAGICAECKTAGQFSRQIQNVLQDYFRDSELKDNLRINTDIKTIGKVADGLFAKHQKNKDNMDNFDKFIDVIKSIFGIDIDSKFIESSSKILTQVTQEVLGKHTAAVMEKRGAPQQQQL